MNDYQNIQARKSNIEDLMRLGNSETEKIATNPNFYKSVKHKNSKKETTKRRNHRLDHLSSYYHPMIPRHYMKRGQKQMY